MSQSVPKTLEDEIAAAEAASAALRNPGRSIRAAAKILHDYDLVARRAHGVYKKSYEELEQTDPIGFEEYNSMVAQALDAADAAS